MVFKPFKPPLRRNPVQPEPQLSTNADDGEGLPPAKKQRLEDNNESTTGESEIGDKQDFSTNTLRSNARSRTSSRLSDGYGRGNADRKPLVQVKNDVVGTRGTGDEDVVSSSKNGEADLDEEKYYNALWYG